MYTVSLQLTSCCSLQQRGHRLLVLWIRLSTFCTSEYFFICGKRPAMILYMYLTLSCEHDTQFGPIVVEMQERQCVKILETWMCTHSPTHTCTYLSLPTCMYTQKLRARNEQFDEDVRERGIQVIQARTVVIQQRGSLGWCREWWTTSRWQSADYQCRSWRYPGLRVTPTTARQGELWRWCLAASRRTGGSLTALAVSLWRTHSHKRKRLVGTHRPCQMKMINLAYEACMWYSYT